MSALDDLESDRLEIQGRLDSAKGQAERNRLGQFATPPALSQEMLEYAKRLMPHDAKVRFLDPAFGTGSFYSALLRAFPHSGLDRALGYEIDPAYGEHAKRLWSRTKLDLRIGDFTRAEPPCSDEEKPNLVICNPPYVRHHHITTDEKRRMQRIVKDGTGARLSGLAGLYCYFLCISDGWMSEGGLAGWLVPSEFMGVNYGREVKRYLLEKVELLHIHRFDPEDVQFDDALVSSAIVWFRKGRPPSDRKVLFTYGGTLHRPRLSMHVPSAQLGADTKWTRFPSWEGQGPQEAPGPRLGDLFTIKRGIATGANDLFVVSEAKASSLELPSEVLTPILPSPRGLSMDEVAADADGNPRIEPRLYLLDCGLPEPEVRSRYPALWSYLKTGIDRGVRDRYLCRHRSPWYAQERRPPPLFLCTYMGRGGRRGNGPFRFILNHSKATAANAYLLLYPKPPFDGLLRKDPDLRRSVWAALNGLSPELLAGEGRVYGGGLHKLEPRELANAPASEIAALFPRLPLKTSKQTRLPAGS